MEQLFGNAQRSDDHQNRDGIGPVEIVRHVARHRVDRRYERQVRTAASPRYGYLGLAEIGGRYSAGSSRLGRRISRMLSTRVQAQNSRYGAIHKSIVHTN